MRHLLFCALLLVIAGCGSSASDDASASSNPPGDTTPTSKVDGAGDTDGAALTAQLAAADRLDGTEDKVISKCAGCALAMAGKSENALVLEGYSLHFCTASCRDRFEDGAQNKVLALTIP